VTLVITFNSQESRHMTIDLWGDRRITKLLNINNSAREQYMVTDKNLLKNLIQKKKKRQACTLTRLLEMQIELDLSSKMST